MVGAKAASGLWIPGDTRVIQCGKPEGFFRGQVLTLQPSFPEPLCPQPAPLESDFLPVLRLWANIDFLSLHMACDTETDGPAIVCLLSRQGRLSAQRLRSRRAKKTKSGLGSHSAVFGLLFCLSVFPLLPRPIWVYFSHSGCPAAMWHA